MFARKDLQDKFKAKYGYDLGVPLNWSAYEDIADFFSERREDDRRQADLRPHGLRQEGSVARLALHRRLAVDGRHRRHRHPNGLPVDEWGIRVAAEKCTPVGASVSRGGATNSPAAVYALTKYIDWMKKYAPKEATGMTFGEAGPVPAQGQIAQQIFWYTAFTADMTKAGLPVVNADGTPKWRMAPGPNGPYWKQGMQNGYQDVGSWTFLKSNDRIVRAAAWLYAQFVTAKTTSLKKSIVGLTFIRDSDIRSDYFTQNAREVRRPGRVLPQPGARGLDADRHQRARLSEAGAAVVEERGRGGDRREDAAAGDGQPGQGDGPGDGAGWSVPAWRTARPSSTPRATPTSG